jgi:hypothetical protein
MLVGYLQAAMPMPFGFLARLWIIQPRYGIYADPFLARLLVLFSK